MRTVYVDNDSLAESRGEDGYVRLGCFPGQETVKVVSSAYKPAEPQPVEVKSTQKKGWFHRLLGL